MALLNDPNDPYGVNLENIKGALQDRQFWQGVMNQGPAVARGVVSGTLGAPVDAVNMALGPYASERPYGGSAQIAELIGSTPQTETVEQLSGLLSPSPAAKMKVAGMAPEMLMGLLGTFAGRASKTADLKMADKAEEMLSKGIDPEKVWNETGWFKGLDGEMRYEISDSGLRTAVSGLTGKPIVSHPKLESAYPNLADYHIMPLNGAKAASGKSLQTGKDTVVFGPGQLNESTAIHELQHIVQGREGFDRGGNARQFTGQTQYVDANGMPLDPKEVYKRLGGEVEARLTQRRLNYLPEQRAAIYPLKDMDVPEKEVIIRKRKK